MPIKGPRKELTMYFKSGNVVTVPLDDDVDMSWRVTNVIESLRVEGIANPVLGFGFNLKDLEAFIVKQV